MKLEDIHSEWERDAAVKDTANLDAEASETPKLHAKYLRYMGNERMIMKDLEEDLVKLVFDKTEYYTGKMPKEELDARGWKPEQRRILSGDVDRYVKADKEVSTLKLRIALQKEKVDELESIVKMVMNRNFVIKSMIDWIKFKNGVG